LFARQFRVSRLRHCRSERVKHAWVLSHAGLATQPFVQLLWFMARQLGHRINPKQGKVAAHRRSHGNKLF
jgi:hypothetical protein